MDVVGFKLQLVVPPPSNDFMRQKKKRARALINLICPNENLDILYVDDN
jgi:hypothetical protein